jgi:glycosyltransferase involved in cell wall biosynthesis
MGSPRVTVTIPTYNRAPRLRRTLGSVLEQSFDDVEVFVSDNASDDDTASVVASFGDPRVHYLRNERNLGHFVNLSVGLHAGTAPYLTVLPDDDVMLPGHLEQKVAFLDEHPAVGLVHSAFRRITQTPGEDDEESDEYPGGSSDWVAPSQSVVRRLLESPYYISYATALVRRSIVSSTECFAAEDRTADDVGLSLRLVCGAGEVGYLARPLVGITFHQEALNTVAGGQVRVDDGYMATFASVANEWRVKRRFLDRFGAALADPADLRRVLDRRMQGEMLTIVKRRTGPTRPPGAVARLLVEAAREEPRLALAPASARYWAGSVVAGARQVAGRHRKGWTVG